MIALSKSSSQKFADLLLDEGVYAVGFFYPVVPKGKARIRTQISAAHSKEDLDKAINAFIKVGTKLNVIWYLIFKKIIINCEYQNYIISSQPIN